MITGVKELISLFFAMLAFSLLCFYEGFEYGKTKRVTETIAKTSVVVVDTLYAIDRKALSDYSKK